VEGERERKREREKERERSGPLCTSGGAARWAGGCHAGRRNIYIYIYICICIYMCIYVYIYIYDRENVSWTEIIGTGLEWRGELFDAVNVI
jgi:hypothetical protein